MTQADIILVSVILWVLIFGIASAVLAASKNRSVVGFFILGALTGLIGLIIAAGLPVSEDEA